MFLAQSFKKVLKQTFQEQKNTKQDGNDLFQMMMEDFERDFGIDSNNPATSPAFHHLIGNSWHCLGKDD